MSTVTVVKKNGHVAIAADTLSSFGSRKLSAVHNKRASKIVRLGASFVGLTGAAANLRVLEHAFRDAEAPALDSAADIFDVFLKLHERLKYEYAMNVRGGAGLRIERNDPADRQPARHLRHLLDARGRRARAVLGGWVRRRLRARRDACAV